MRYSFKNKLNLMMKMKLKIGMAGLCFMLVACGSSSQKAMPVAPQDPTKSGENGTGPFLTDFNNPSQIYVHTLNIPIDQSEGKIEYYITNPEVRHYKLESVQLSVVGCDPQNVQHNIYWMPDSSSTLGYSLKVGDEFSNRASTQGSIINAMTGLSGCTSIEFTISIRLLPATPPSSSICKGDSIVPDCKVAVYCKEQDPLSSFVEVEVWVENNGNMTLRKFMNHGDGTRGTMNHDSVTMSSTSNSIIYAGSSSSAGQLNINKISKEAVYSINLFGTIYRDYLDCTLSN